MKMFKLLFVLSLAFSAQAFASRPLQDASDVDLVREVLLRGIEIDASKVATISAVCKGSSLFLTTTNEEAASKSEIVNFVGGITECQRNLSAIQSKIGPFYNKEIVNVCNGSSLIAITADSSLSFNSATPRYIGADCLKAAIEANNGNL